MRWPPSDADVLACYPYLFATTVDSHRRLPGSHRAPPGRPRRARPLSLRLPSELPRHRRFRVPHPGRARSDGARVRHRWPTPDRPRSRGRRAGRGGGAPVATSSVSAIVPTSATSAGSTSTRDAECWPSTSTSYKERHPGDLALAFVGPVSRQGPGASRHRGHRHGVRGGQVGHPGRRQVMVNPSAYESFSLVLLEAWTLGIPVLVNASCAATMEHCRASGGGPVVRVLPIVRGRGRAVGGRPAAATDDWARPGTGTRPGTTGGRRSSTGTPGFSKVSRPGVTGPRSGPAGSSSRAVAPSTFGEDECSE